MQRVYYFDNLRYLMEKSGANLLEIFLRRNDILQKDLYELGEMTYSSAVNVRDFSISFKRLVDFWDRHEEMEEKILEVLGDEGYQLDIDKLIFKRGELMEVKNKILEVINKGEDEAVKKVIKEDISQLLDLLKAHLFAVDEFFARVSWEELMEETLTKIRLLQIIPSEDILRGDWKSK